MNELNQLLSFHHQILKVRVLNSTIGTTGWSVKQTSWLTQGIFTKKDDVVLMYFSSSLAHI